MKERNMANFRKTVKNIFMATAHGELLLRMGADKFLLHIAYLFLIVWISLFINLKIDGTMVRLENNRRTLEDLRIYHAQKTCELAGYDRFSKVQELLEKSGSKVALPQKPAETLK